MDRADRACGVLLVAARRQTRDDAGFGQGMAPRRLPHSRFADSVLVEWEAKGLCSRHSAGSLRCRSRNCPTVRARPQFRVGRYAGEFCGRRLRGRSRRMAARGVLRIQMECGPGFQLSTIAISNRSEPPSSFPCERGGVYRREGFHGGGNGRGGGIRTRDPLLPKQVRYQTAPRPDSSLLYLHARLERRR